MQQSDVYYQHCLNMFRASLCPFSGEQRPCVTACGVLRWFCWMWLVAVVGRCQPHPAEPVQHTTCSNTRLVLLKMGIMMTETFWDSVDNIHLIVASCWFSLSLHILLTMHGHRNLKMNINFYKFLQISLPPITETSPQNLMPFRVRLKQTF